MQPKSKQLKALDDKIRSLSNKIQQEGYDLFDSKATEKELLSICRTAVRKAWMRHPVKLLKLEMAKEPDTSDSRNIWKVKCEICGEYHKLSDIEIDHIQGEYQLISFNDLTQFAKSVLHVTLNDLQVLCKECHLNKTYAEREGVSWEQARYCRYAIAIEKKLKSADKIKNLLDEHGLGMLPSNNSKMRRLALIELAKIELN